jgi:hypothetical protein
MSPLHFSARIDQQPVEGDYFRIKILSRDIEKWQSMLGVLNTHQVNINNFLLASSGK